MICFTVNQLATVFHSKQKKPQSTTVVRAVASIFLVCSEGERLSALSSAWLRSNVGSVSEGSRQPEPGPILWWSHKDNVGAPPRGSICK